MLNITLKDPEAGPLAKPHTVGIQLTLDDFLFIKKAMRPV